MCMYCELPKNDPRIEIGNPNFDADIRLLWIVDKMYHERAIPKIKHGACISPKKLPVTVEDWF